MTHPAMPDYLVYSLINLFILCVQVLVPRKDNVEYEVSHWHGTLIMEYRDATCANSQIVVAPMSDPSRQRVVLAHRDAVKIEDIEVSDKFVAVFEREGGLQRCIVYPLPMTHAGDEARAAPSAQCEFSKFSNYEFSKESQSCFLDSRRQWRIWSTNSIFLDVSPQQMKGCFYLNRRL